MTEPLRILVCGSRDYTNKEKIWHILDALQSKLDQPLVLITGMARGADTWAAMWGSTKIPRENQLDFPAQWHKYGRAAGPKRNQQMLDEGKPDLVIAFGGLNGRGTNDMVRRSKNAGILVLEFDRA
jgi:hypothetical protein